MTAGKQRRTFISYSRVNKEFALKLAKELRADGYSIWLDQLDIPTGARWDNELEKALEECEIFLLILTPAAIASENVKDEIGYAIDNNKRIQPILLENCNVPLRLRRFQYVDFTTITYDEGVERSKQMLNVLISEPTIPVSSEGTGNVEKQSARETAARIVMRRTASNRYISEQASVIKASNLLMEGKKLAQNGDWSGASQKFRQVLELIPDHGETKNLLANVEAKLLEESESLRKQEQAERSERPEDIKPPEIIPVQEEPVPVEKVPTGFSRKTIGFGALAVVGLIGITSAVIWLFGNNRSPVSSVGMVKVPAGSYTVGADTTMTLDEYWIDRYEVTNRDYAAFIDDTRNKPPAYWTGGEVPTGMENHPVSHITWDQAREYCGWAGKRLPTEAEWDVAARGPFGWKYPWGNNPDPVRQETQSTRPVDYNPANRSYFGAYYMSGNVWEWVGDPYSPTGEDEHVLRGGAYGPLDVLMTAISVKDDSPAVDKAGFRCASSGDTVEIHRDDFFTLEDNFINPGTHWPGIHEDNFLFDYHEVGYYHLEAREPNKFITAFYDHDSFSNFVMETEVFVDRANTDNQNGNFQYGLGVQTSDDQFYAFLVSAKDQRWQVVKGVLKPDAVIGDSSDLDVIASDSDTSIRGASEGEEDRLTVIANEKDFLYYVNGNLVHAVTLDDRSKVKIGFIVETLDDVTRVHIHYNWFTLQAIEPFEN